MISPEKGLRIVHLKSKNTQGGRGEKEGTEILTGRMEKHTGGKGKSHNIPTENSRHRHKRLTHYSLANQRTEVHIEVDVHLKSLTKHHQKKKC